MRSIIKIIFYTISILFFILIIYSLLSIPIKSLRYNLIHGGDRLPDYSDSIFESKKREVFRCLVKEVSIKYTDGGHIVMIPFEEGWVEQAWDTGYWYWDTFPDNMNYNIKLNGVNHNGHIFGNFRFSMEKNARILISFYRDILLIKGIKTISEQKEIIVDIEKRNIEKGEQIRIGYIKINTDCPNSDSSIM